MQQTEISIDRTVCHAKIKSDVAYCGVAVFQDRDAQEAIVKESLEYFRLMTFFKNYNYEGPADILLIYLWVVEAHMFRTIEKIQNQADAKKKLDEIAREPVPRPSDKKNFLGGLMRDSPDFDKLQPQLKVLKEVAARQILDILFTQGALNFEAKFWFGIAKRKFMGLQY